MDLRLRQYGEKAILLQGLSEAHRANLIHLLRKELPPACREYVLGYDSLLFLYKNAVVTEDLKTWLSSHLSTQAEAVSPAPLRKVPVVYDGPDLEGVAQKTGLTVDAVIALHCKAVYTVRMIGFSPGFPYLDGLDTQLQIPRKETPVKHVVPGAVAIGGPHAGIYSVASPGGWHLLGRTPLELFNPDAARDEAPEENKVFCFAPGDRIQFYLEK